MALSPDNPFVQLAGLAMTPDRDRPTYLAAHPQLQTAPAADAALEIARLRGMTGDREAAFTYAGAALFIARQLRDRELELRACQACIAALEALGRADLAKTYRDAARKLTSS